jgi:hypothetical protein
VDHCQTAAEEQLAEDAAVVAARTGGRVEALEADLRGRAHERADDERAPPMKAAAPTAAVTAARSARRSEVQPQTDLGDDWIDRYLHGVVADPHRFVERQAR